MLSAQKQKMPSPPPTGTPQPPTTGGFGKVLHSIQGLQQRLDDFSIDEVSRSHARAHELIRELGSLRARLNAVAKLKDAIVGISTRIAALPQDNCDLAAPDSLEKYPQLRAILQTGKLIREQRLLQGSQANAQPLRAAAKPASTSAPVIAAAPVEKRARESSAVESPESGAASRAVAQEFEPRLTYDFSDLRLEEPPQAPPTKDSPQPLMARAKHAPASKGKKAKGKPHFDQRLLDDLIETYGEFAVSTGAAGGAERSQSIPSGREPTMPAAVTPMPISEKPAALDVALVRPKEIRANELVPVEPAFVQAGAHQLLAPPTPAEQSAGPSFDEVATTAKARGEIDRQLKSIIKDYGEVDLYSHRQSPKLKTLKIAAAAALALLLGAFYFFSSPSTPPPASMEPVAPAGASQDPRAKQILKQQN